MLFSRLINADNNNKWYTMEKINGVVFGIIYLSNELVFNNLEKLLNILNTLHNYNETIIVDNDSNNNNKINIYANYLEKIKARYIEEDYSVYPQSEIIFKELCHFFTNYQNKRRGKIGIIHGDPVFTNIILDKYNNIKMIDIEVN